MEKLTEENNKLKCEMKLQKEELFEREKEYKEMENKLCQSYQEKEELARKVSKGIIKEDEFVTRLWSLKEVNKNLQKRLDERDQEKKLLQQKIIVLSLQTPQEHKHEDESVTTQEDEDGLRSIPSTFTPQEEPEMVCISKTELNKLLQSYQENHQLKIERLQEQLQKLSLQTPQEHEDESVTTQEEKQIPVCPLNLIKKASFSAGYSVHQEEVSTAFSTGFSAGYSTRQQEIFPAYSAYQQEFSPQQLSAHQQKISAAYSTYQQELSAHQQELSTHQQELLDCAKTAELLLNSNVLTHVASEFNIQNVAMLVGAVQRVTQMAEGNVGLLAFDYHNRGIGHCVCFEKTENQQPQMWDAQKKGWWLEEDYSTIKAVHCYEVNNAVVIASSATCDCLSGVIQQMENDSTNATIIALT